MDSQLRQEALPLRGFFQLVAQCNWLRQWTDYVPVHCPSHRSQCPCGSSRPKAGRLAQRTGIEALLKQSLDCTRHWLPAAHQVALGTQFLNLNTTVTPHLGTQPSSSAVAEAKLDLPTASTIMLLQAAFLAPLDDPKPTGKFLIPWRTPPDQ